MKEFINQYGITLIHSIAALSISYITITIKHILKKYTTDITKKEVIKTVCNAINQLYPDLNGNDKLNKAITNSKEILAEKGIKVSDLELRMYIESNIYYLKKNTH